MEMIKKEPTKIEREKSLRDYYMYFIEDKEGLTDDLINQFKNDVDEIMSENPLYQKLKGENNAFDKHITKVSRRK
jgi:hypothetical protein